MKKKYVEFSCDFCEKKLMKSENYWDKNERGAIPKEYPFPYDEEWIYLHSLIFKTSPNEKTKESPKNECYDRHFCSEECLFKFLKKRIKETKMQNLMENLDSKSKKKSIKNILFG